MIKILNIELTQNFGGIESLLSQVSKRIDRDKFQYDFIAMGYGDYQEVIQKMGSRIFVLSPEDSILKFRKQFINIIKKNYDIVHFHKNSLANYLPILWTKLYSKKSKIILHSHNTAPSVNDRKIELLHSINKKLFNDIPDYKIGCSIKAAEYMFNSKDNFRVIHNGIDTKKFTFSLENRYKIRKELGISQDDLIIGNIGRFSKQKNHKRLVQIFYELHKIKHNSKLLLIGEGELEEEIRSLSKKYNLQDDIKFLGHKDNVNEYLSAIDIVLMPSFYEGLSIASVEAQCSGSTLFLSDTISHESAITNNVYFFSLNTSNYKIANYILQNYTQLNERKKLLQAEIVKKTYDINTTVKELSNIYEEITNVEK